MIGRVKRLLPLVLLVCLGVGCGSSHASSHACAGSDFVLRVVPQHGATVTPAGMKLVRKIIAGRVGTSSKVEIRGGDEIVVTGSPVKIVGSNVTQPGGVHLEFFDFEKDLVPPTVTNGNPTPWPYHSLDHFIENVLLRRARHNKHHSATLNAGLVYGSRANFTASTRPAKRSPDG